jgi:hypothetical protein
VVGLWQAPGLLLGDDPAAFRFGSLFGVVVSVVPTALFSRLVRVRIQIVT